MSEKKSLSMAYAEKEKSDSRSGLWRRGEVPPLQESEREVEEEAEEHGLHEHDEFCPEGCDMDDEEKYSKGGMVQKKHGFGAALRKRRMRK